MNYTYQRIGIWSGVAFFLLFWLACVTLMGFVPPPLPTATGQELLANYQQNLFGVRLGVLVGLIAAPLLVPLSAVIAIQMARIEGQYPMMSIVAFGAGVMNGVAFLFPFVFWAAAVYRMDRMPEVVQIISDMAWLEFVMLFSPFFVQNIAIALVGLSDKSMTPTFPRWFCFFCIWISILVTPGGFAIFFLTGPFAWNGLLAFWLVVVAFCLYFVVLIPVLFKAVNRQEAAISKA